MGPTGHLVGATELVLFLVGQFAAPTGSAPLWPSVGSCSKKKALLVQGPLAGAPEVVLFPKQFLCMLQVFRSPKSGAASQMLLGSCCCQVAPQAEAGSVLQLEKVCTGNKAVVVDSTPSF